MHRAIVRVVALTVVAAAVVACGDDRPTLNGSVREPAPTVDAVALPDLSNGGAPFDLRADPGELLVVYFGYTNCPDVCPTTLADMRFALNRMDPVDADRVRLAMVTIDPDRDIPLLAKYVQSFVPGAHALGTTDAELLAAAAEPFGASYSVETLDDGSIEVAHSAQLYAVDERGELVVTWLFGTSADDIAADLTTLLTMSA